MESTVLKGMAPELLNQRTTVPHKKTAEVATLSVTLKDSDHDEPVIINATDFDASQHELVTEDKAKKIKIKSLGKGTKEDPSEEYKVYKSFPYDDLFFEKNSTVVLKKSVAKVLSERFRCIWPKKDEKAVDENPTKRDALIRGLGGELEERDPANLNTPGV